MYKYNSKIALLGDSNSIIKYGYGHILKKYFNDKLDIYSIGATGSIHALYEILYQNINKNYEYVIIDKCVNDTAHVLRDGLNPNFVSGTLTGIQTLLQAHSVCALYVILPNDAYARNPVITNIYKKFCNDYDLDFLDFEDKYNMLSDITTEDKIHFRPEYQEHIASNIIDFIERGRHKNNAYILPELVFQLFNPMLQRSEVTITQFKTSLRTSRATMVTNGMQFDLPLDIWPVACAFWNKTGMTSPDLYSKTPGGISIASVNWHWNGFCVRAFSEINQNNSYCSGGGGGGGGQ